MSAFQNLRLSLEGSSLSATLGRQRLRCIDPDGTMVYEDESISTKITENVERIWNEFPGGLLDVTEAALFDLPLDDTASGNKVDTPEDLTNRHSSKMLDWEEMEKLRSEIYTQLNDARNELWYVLELVKTLSVSTTSTINPPTTAAAQLTPKKGKTKATIKAIEPEPKPGLPSAASTADPPILPSGTYSTTAAPADAPSSQSHDNNLELALAAKQQALEECSSMIDSAVDELQRMAGAGDRFWESLQTLQGNGQESGQWAIVPKPDFGRSMAEGERAKDVIIPYAVDEAPPLLRARCLAAFDLDPTKEDILTFGARTYRRLQVLSHTSTASTSSSRKSGHTSLDILADMDDAQMEAFDDELFGEISAEILRHGLGSVDPTSVTIEVSGVEYRFAMYDTRQSQISSTSSAECDLILLFARLFLLQTHRKRKQSRINTFRPPVTSIVAPICELLIHRQTSETIHSTLKIYSKAILAAGVSSNVVTRNAMADEASTDLLLSLVEGDGRADVFGSTISIDIEDRTAMWVDVSPSLPPQIRTSRASFALNNMEDLPHIIAETLSRQLLLVAVTMLQEMCTDDNVKERIFIDDLDETISLADLGSLSVSITPDPVTVQTKLDKSDAGVEHYAGGDGSSSFNDWLHDIYARLLGGDGEVEMLQG